jgi:hypothetical protein
MLKIRSMWFLLGVLLCSGCTSITAHRTVIMPRETPGDWIKTELYCGMNRPGGGTVSTEEWQRFLDDIVTPRFEEGLTVLDGYGQYWSRTQGFVQEATKILVLIHPDSAETDATIDYIRRVYCKRFDQEAVLRVDVRVDAAGVVGWETRDIPAIQRAVLENQEINESSGLAASTLRGDLLWTHNDSGDVARFFALDLHGRDRGVFTVDGVKARDWEDMASVKMDNASWLVFADVGNNDLDRKIVTLYFVQEPEAVGQNSAPQTVPLVRTIRFRFEDGPQDCEALAVDPVQRRIFLVGKRWGWTCGVYELDWDAPSDQKVVAHEIAELTVPLVTAMDVSSDGRTAVVLTYGDAYAYHRHDDETWADAFSRPGIHVPMPKREQGESLCFSEDGLLLYVTSEKLPAPLWEVPVPDMNAAAPQ